MEQTVKTKGEPSSVVKKAISGLGSLGKAIVAIRGDGFSCNLIGPVGLGRDGGDQVITVGDCKCHIHIDWGKADKFIVDEEDVGYGPEPVARLVDSEGKPIVHFFYPWLSKEKLIAVCCLS